MVDVIALDTSASLADWISAIGQAAGAVGTVAAVVVALFLPGWQRAKMRPIVTLEFDRTSEDLAVYESPPWASVWIRLRATNRPGRETARKVRVIASKVEPEEGSVLPENTLALRELTWSEVRAGELDLPPGMQRRIDVAHVDKKRTAKRDVVTPWPELGMGLAGWPQRYDGRDYLGEGAFWIKLTVAGENLDATEWEIRISFKKAGLSNRSSLARIRDAIEVSDPVLVSKETSLRRRRRLTGG
ncbi:hypothetical protein [Nucisporomicrobium flavum]|uniref:hypothetical protein n=1 Tax=Nucisporomicrobium flavum TaxID=2785915 RepID=UPI0018F3D07E|nr:hypothetical protein [Nucisporomicrobium flavum]